MCDRQIQWYDQFTHETRWTNSSRFYFDALTQAMNSYMRIRGRLLRNIERRQKADIDQAARTIVLQLRNFILLKRLRLLERDLANSKAACAQLEYDMLSRNTRGARAT